MGIGVVAIQTSAKKEQSGPPFVTGAADNGLSVDTTSGKIVLGNDVGDPAEPAVLLSNREIVTETLLNLFSIALNSIITGITTTLDGQQVNVAGSAGTSPRVVASSSGGGSSLLRAAVSGGAGGTAELHALASVGDTGEVRLQSGNTDVLRIFTVGGGQISFELGLLLNIMTMDTVNFTTQIGSNQVAFNGADLQVSGNLTNRRFIQGQSGATFNVNRDTDSGKIIRNTAILNVVLPNMAAANLRNGFIVRCAVNNAAGITITAFAGQTIRFGSLATSAGGTLNSTDVGAYIEIVLTDSNTWFTASFLGAWILT